MKFGNTITSEIEKIIFSLKPKNSYGYDEISARISSPLIHIFNKIPITDTFPDRLKFSEVKPLYKKGDKSDVANYRPISLPQHFPKLSKKLFIKNYIPI
jgi:hypothetical protein